MFSNYKRNFAQVLFILIFLINPLCSKKTEEGENGGLGNTDSEKNKGILIPSDSEEKDEQKVGKKNNPVGYLYLPENYNKFEIPDEAKALGLNPSPLNIKVHIRVREIGDLNELDEKITITLDVRLWWKDWQIFRANQNYSTSSGEGFNFVDDPDNQQLKPKKLDPSFLTKIWKPDLFIESLVSTARPEFVAKPVKVVYNADGTLVVQSRVTVTVGCNMDFHYYPADTQECPFNIRSYAFESDEMELEWGSPPPSIYAFDRRSTNFEIQLTAPNLTRIIEPSLDVPENSISWGGGPAQEIVPQKRITWLCFVFPPRMVEVRIGITMTTLLTMTAMFSSVRESTPIVSYMKAIDIWMIACIAFVFFTLLEFAALVWFGAHEADDKKKEEDSSQHLKKNESMENFEMQERNGSRNILTTGVNRTQGTSAKKKKWVACSVHTNLERFVMLFFLLLFLTFCVLYYLWLFNYSGYSDWEVDYTYNVADEE